MRMRVYDGVRDIWLVVTPWLTYYTITLSSANSNVSPSSRHNQHLLTFDTSYDFLLSLNNISRKFSQIKKIIFLYSFPSKAKGYQLNGRNKKIICHSMSYRSNASDERINNFPLNSILNWKKRYQMLNQIIWSRCCSQLRDKSVKALSYLFCKTLTTLQSPVWSPAEARRRRGGAASSQLGNCLTIVITSITRQLCQKICLEIVRVWLMQ